MRVMALDYGSVTVGVAMTDPSGLICQPLETITRKEEKKLRRTLARITELTEEYGVETIVVGLPKNMDDSEGERCRLVREFAGMVERRTGREIVLWDERLTTVAAEDVLIESGVRRENRKAVIDKIAAALILEGYINNEKQETNE